MRKRSLGAHNHSSMAMMTLDTGKGMLSKKSEIMGDPSLSGLPEDGCGHKL